MFSGGLSRILISKSSLWISETLIIQRLIFHDEFPDSGRVSARPSLWLLLPNFAPLRSPLSQTQARARTLSGVLHCTWSANIVPLSTGGVLLRKSNSNCNAAYTQRNFSTARLLAPFWLLAAPVRLRLHLHLHLHPACNSRYLPSQFRLFVVGPPEVAFVVVVCCFYGGRNCNVLISPISIFPPRRVYIGVYKFSLRTEGRDTDTSPISQRQSYLSCCSNQTTALSNDALICLGTNPAPRPAIWRLLSGNICTIRKPFAFQLIKMTMKLFCAAGAECSLLFLLHPVAVCHQFWFVNFLKC